MRKVFQKMFLFGWLSTLFSVSLVSANSGGTMIAPVYFKNIVNKFQRGGYVTFGHVFKKGDWPSNHVLVGKVGNFTVGLQTDVKARYDDGSVRHAVVTSRAPNLSPDQTIALTLYSQATGPSRQNQDHELPPLDLQLKVIFPDTSVVLLNAMDVLEGALVENKAIAWLDGPMVKEYAVNKKINAHLTAQFHIRIYADQSVRTDVIVAREHSYVPGNVESESYRAQIIQNGAILHDHEVAHNHHANWHKLVWWRRKSDLYTSFDVQYMKEAGAIPQYDLSLKVKESRLSWNESFYSDPSFLEPMQGGGLNPWMGAHGGRFEIGTLNERNVMWLLSQDHRMKKVSDIVCDASGSVPWHFRDGANDGDGDGLGDYLRVDLHPNVWIDFRDFDNGHQSADQLADPYHPNVGTTPAWRPDVAHQPSLCYLPYLISGDLYRLNELHAQASWTLGFRFPQYRQYGLGLYYSDGAPQREVAWFTRLMSNVDYITPDNHPLKDFFSQVFNNNMDYAIAAYVHHGLSEDFNFATEQEGYTRYATWRTPYGWTSPWQDYYWKQSLSWLARRGDSRALSLLKWGEKFTTGLVLDSGRPFSAPTSYHLYVYEAGTEFQSRYYFETWDELVAINLLEGGIDAAANDIEGGAVADSYAGLSRAALTHLASLLLPANSTDPQGLRALEAAGFMIGHTPAMVTGFGGGDWGLNYNPVNLTELTVNNTPIPIGNQRSGTHGDDDLQVYMSDVPQLLHGQEGNDQIYGGGGVDILFGGSGQDLLHAGEGDDYVFGGAGNDQLIGSLGRDILKGGPGEDEFIFGQQFGQDIVVDYEPGIDRLSMPKVLSTTDEPNGVMLHFGDGNTILFEGHSLGSLFGSN